MDHRDLVVGSRWRHLKTCRDYIVVVPFAMLEKDGLGGPAMVVYRSTIDVFKTWIRPQSEFLDGRFELVKENSDAH